MRVKSVFHSKSIKLSFILIAVLMIITGLLLITGQTVSAQGSPLHPTFPLLDSDGNNVLENGNPVSTMQTCRSCHNTDFIAEHSFHADVGLSSFGQVSGGYDWDSSPGHFGSWNPLNYRYLSITGDETVDLTTAEWIQTLGVRHVGGGPAVYARNGERLDDINADLDELESSIIDPQTGELVPWDWQESGVVEMNCFLCHTTNPDNDARVTALQAGNFKWANTATLLQTGMVEYEGEEWLWNEASFDEDGNLLPEFITIQDPDRANCSHCHGLTQVDTSTPLVINDCAPSQWSTITTGQIFSPQRLYDSGVNFTDKDELSRSWDIHAERVLDCTDCHYSLNNPVYFQESDATRPDHLTFDPRRIDLSEYLYRPLHEFAKGQSAQSNLAPELDNTLRRCESCHDAEVSHEWLPYLDRHTTALSCETCHIPQLYAPSRQSNDWTVLNLDGSPQTECRGVEGDGDSFATALITGFQPVLMPRQNADGSVSLAPYNLVSSWFWVYGEPQRPVPYRNLQAAWLEDGEYHSDILDTFDSNNDGLLDDKELIIDNDAKETLITSRLSEQGLENPQITATVQPYSVNHNVATDEWAIKECDACHSDDSRLNSSLSLITGELPGGVTPTFISNDTVVQAGELFTDNGTLFYKPQLNAAPTELYILGHDNVYWIDLLGTLMFLGTLLGATAHGGMRYFAARSRVPHEPELRREYMYSVYGRQWHWLQTIVIVILIFTGFIIHKPDQFGIFSFRYVVEVHNVMAFILVVNATLAAFYHLVSGEIQQFLPEPRGFFSQAFEQVGYYTRGIFRGENHPVEKSRNRKLNPLQQITYLAILNILLPLQIITGALMWGVQRWAETADSFGGLPYLAPFHSLIAWTFATFIVLHVYLTTTAGHTPLAGIKSMITGWDDLEVHNNDTEAAESAD